MLNSHFNKHHCCDHELHGTDNLLAKELIKLLTTIEETLKSKPEIDTNVLVDKDLLKLSLENINFSILSQVYSRGEVDEIVYGLENSFITGQEVHKLLENYPTLYALTTMLEGYATDAEVKEKYVAKEVLDNYLTTEEVMNNITDEVAKCRVELEKLLASKYTTKTDHALDMNRINSSIDQIEDRLTVIEGGSKTTLDSGNVLH